MATGIAMPSLGLTMKEGMVVAWPLEIGASVSHGETVLIIESDKAEVEIEATESGVFSHIYVEPDEVVPCGTLLAVILEAGEEGFDPEAFHAQWQSEQGPGIRGDATASDEPQSPGAAPRADARATSKRGRTPSTPAARKRAKELGVAVEAATGTGPGGRITKEDVEVLAARSADLVEVAEGVRLEVPSQGEGDPVVLLPGFGTDVSAFSAQIPALTQGFAVRGVNGRGVGQSDAPDAERYDVATMAADVAALIDAPAHVIGTSLGTAVAIELALSHPEKVRSLCLLAPLVEVGSHLEAVSDAWCRLATEASPETLARALLPWFFGSATLADPKRRAQIVRGLATTLAQVPATTLTRVRAGMLAWSGSREADLGRIEVPTLVVVADDDLLTPGGEAVAQAIRGARLEHIEGAGHAVGLEAPEPVNAAILALLSA